MTNSKFKKTEQTLNNDGSTPDLKGVIDGRDPGEVDVFGYQVIYTTGDFIVPREKLIDKMVSLGFPTNAAYMDGEVPWMAPGKVAPHRAFGRAKDDLFAEVDYDGENYAEMEYDGHVVKFDLEQGSSHYEQHAHARVYYDADDTGMTEGQYVDHELGVIKYDGDRPGPVYVDRVDDDDELFAVWKNAIKPRMENLFEMHREHHLGDDINNMVYYLARQWTDSIKLRDSCYFVPATYQFRMNGEDRNVSELIDAFRELYSWINTNYKTRGQDTELFAIEIVDSDRQKEMVESKVRGELEDQVDTVFDDLVSEVTEGADVDEVAEDVVDALDDVDDVAERHSTVLKTKLSVERAMERALKNSDEERAELVQKVLDEVGIAPGDDAPEVTA